MYFGRVSFILYTLFHTIRYVHGHVETIHRYGRYLFFSNGTQFFVKGVAYQQPLPHGYDGHYVDPLANSRACTRDLKLFLELGINTVRVYTIDPFLDHSYCMNLFAKNGIYVILDLSEPRNSIISTSPSWDVSLFLRYSQVIDSMHHYPNLIGFFAGNEVVLDTGNTHAAAFVKAAIRDTKAYIRHKHYRKILVGYAANDHQHTRIPSANYFACGDDSIAADFFGINIYEWCEPTTFETSGYKDRVQDFLGYNIPLILSEFGCNIVNGKLGTRTFKQIRYLYSDKMTSVFSGGIVYEWYHNVNSYGLVIIHNDDSVSPREDYHHLKNQLSLVNPKLLTSSKYTPTEQPPECPVNNQHWSVSTNLPPVPNSELCACASSASSCVSVSDISDNEMADIFSYICSEIDCRAISKNGQTGIYGAYSVCLPRDQLNVILGLYHRKHNRDSACFFKGSAFVTTPRSSKSCSSLLRIAGEDGSGSISGPPYVTTHVPDTDGKDKDESSGKNIYFKWELLLGICTIFIGIAFFITA
ncbi:uncharacterized protein T551_02310 [Pneumocystis jirovecii RU7]|uniref:1,3-beta-glucanosyltransferase n=1 Tax=Pneumocystis jirovecii (strain RU7) TaxID=1408657 RepID=A0A0W4ZKX1_PNEJ7|nr:uncharacterized protein T551_02310 [Pneumocystis jirovecii RU7]KTW29036.1 hypothetical protein T551_02310 [Pneumocystis jirovecii RU7]